jgi:hypothetical protein
MHGMNVSARTSSCGNLVYTGVLNYVMDVYNSNYQTLCDIFIVQRRIMVT